MILLRSLRVDWVPTPYTRIPLAARWSKRSKRYYASRDRLIAEMQRWGRIDLSHVGRFRVGVAVFLQPVKSGPNKGRIPQTGGDWDNYFKAVVDSMVRGEILDRDDGSRVAGPCDVGSMFPSGIYAVGQYGVKAPCCFVFLMEVG